MLAILACWRLPIGSRGLRGVGGRSLLLLTLLLVPLLLSVACLLGLVSWLLLAICCWLGVAALAVTCRLAVSTVADTE